MLSIQKIRSAQDAKHYFEKDNYYTQDGALEDSYWYGKAALSLGLEHNVHSDQFFDLLDGSFSGTPLGRTVDGVRQHSPGWDCTFSAPKSVSILAEALEMKEIREAHSAAVKRALDFIEREASTARVQVNGHKLLENTGNLCFAAFTHDTSRELDPQLHTHCVLMNGTETSQGWRSLDSRKLFQLKMTAGQYYRNELAQSLRSLGYDIRITGKNGLFEIEGFDEESLKHFSTRRQQIEDYLKANNLPDTPANCELATLNTRKSKTEVDRVELRQLWRDRAETLGLTHDHFRNDSPLTPATNAKLVVRRSIRYLSEHNMAFSRNDILNECFRHNLGETSSRAVVREIERLKEIGVLKASDNELLTTKQGRDLEKAIIRQHRANTGLFEPILSGLPLEELLSQTFLNEDQASAIANCLKSRDRFIGIQGSAGTGKTTALSILNDILKENGFDVTALGPTHTALKELASSLGVTTKTIDSFLLDSKPQAQDKPAIWIVDEASFPSAKKILQLQKRAVRDNARIVFVGDVKQLESIEAGRAFKLLQDSGMDTATITTVMRQKDEALHDAVTHVIRDEFDQALEKIDSSVLVNDNNDERISQMVEDWKAFDKTERDGVLMITPSNDERQKANTLAHQALKDLGELTGESLPITTLTNQQVSNRQSRNVSYYRNGQVLRFRRDYKATSQKAGDAISKNEYYSVVGIDHKANRLLIQSRKDGREFSINPNKRAGNRAGGIMVFSEHQVNVNVGEKLRWTDNSNKMGLKTNEELSVQDIQGQVITAKSRTGDVHQIDVSELSNRHFTYNYANTVYSAQGKSCDHVLAQAYSHQLNLVNRKSFYVTLSRAKHSLKIYTDDKDKLANAISRRLGENTMALKQKTVERIKQQTPKLKLDYLI